MSVGQIQRLVNPDLPLPPSFDSNQTMTLDNVAEIAAGVAGVEIRPYSTFDFGRDKEPAARSLLVSNKTGERVLKGVRERLPAGFIAFLGTSRWLGNEKHNGKSELVLASGADQFDILRVARSDAVNYDMYAEDLIVRLKKYHEQIGIDIIHAETDTIDFECTSLPANIVAFCDDLYEFCPDIVDQGVGSVEALADAVRRTKRVQLWWD